MTGKTLELWICYLKSNQIAAQEPDSVTKQIRYRRPVYGRDLARFLEVKMDLDASDAHALVTKVMGRTSLLAASYADHQPFTEDSGPGLNESDVKRVLTQAEVHLASLSVSPPAQEASSAVQSSQAELLEKAKEMASDTLRPEQVPVLHGMLATLSRGQDVLSPQAISGTFIGLAIDPKLKKGWLARLRGAPSPVPSDLTAAWLRAGAPSSNDDFVQHLVDQGFDPARVVAALQRASTLQDIEPYITPSAHIAMLKMARYLVRAFDAENLSAFLAHLRIR